MRFLRRLLDAIKHETEEYVLAGKVCYLYTPVGFGVSKLAERYERLLGVAATARNWNTVTKLLEMAKDAKATELKKQTKEGVRSCKIAFSILTAQAAGLPKRKGVGKVANAASVSPTP